MFIEKKKLNTSLSDSRILICREAFSLSRRNRMGLKHDLARIFHTKFCNGGPVFSHSFKDAESLFGLAEALYTILILVVSADSRITGLCRK